MGLNDVLSPTEYEKESKMEDDGETANFRCYPSDNLICTIEEIQDESKVSSQRISLK